MAVLVGVIKKNLSQQREVRDINILIPFLKDSSNVLHARPQRNL